jgi:hypothetical protein
MAPPRRYNHVSSWNITGKRKVPKVLPSRPPGAHSTIPLAARRSRRTYGVVVGGVGAAGAGAVSIGAEGLELSISDAWRRELGTMRTRAITEMTTARIRGNQPLSSLSGVFGSDILFLRWFNRPPLTSRCAAYRHSSRIASWCRASTSRVRALERG